MLFLQGQTQQARVLYNDSDHASSDLAKLSLALLQGHIPFALQLAAHHVQQVQSRVLDMPPTLRQAYPLIERVRPVRTPASM